MSKKRRGNSLPPFVPLTWDMLNSKAYKDLPASAAKALPYFIGKVKTGYNDPQRYNIEFSLSYREGLSYGFSSATFYKVIIELVEHGFIDPVDKGGLRSSGKALNIFSLSYRWKNYNKPEFKTLKWRCFQPRLKSKATLKSEMNSFKKGNENRQKAKSFSHFKAVEAVLT